MPDHPFDDNIVTAIADEGDVQTERLHAVLEDVQRWLERDDGEYEFSTTHSYGWQDGEAHYLYGSGNVWETIRRDLSVANELAEAARSVHRRAMLESASARGEAETVEEMFDERTEPLVVVNPDGGPPRFGQDV